MKISKTLPLLLCALAAGCGIIRENWQTDENSDSWSFGQELSFFNRYGIQTVILSDGDSVAAVSPQFQGRVLTSTYGGVEAPSLGWINRPLIAFQKDDMQKARLGGEDCFEVGPGGGDESIFFSRGKIFSEENWTVPAWVSKEPWELVAHTRRQAKFAKVAEFENAKGTRFKVKAEREVSLLTRKNATDILGIEIPDSVKIVAFQSLNKISNAGDKAWSPEYGRLNITVSGYFNASKNTFVFIPFRQGDVSKFGDIVRDDYFEPAMGITDSSKRLLVTQDYIRFRADAKALSGISVPPRRSEGIALSYDDAKKVLTVITYLRPADKREYLASSWRRTPNPNDDGDAISVFNNGPLSRTSAPAEPYFQISTYSPAIHIAPGRSQFHLQRTFHFNGSEYDLGLISYKLAGISIGQLRGESE